MFDFKKLFLLVLFVSVFVGGSWEDAYGMGKRDTDCIEKHEERIRRHPERVRKLKRRLGILGEASGEEGEWSSYDNDDEAICVEVASDSDLPPLEVEEEVDDPDFFHVMPGPDVEEEGEGLPVIPIPSFRSCSVDDLKDVAKQIAQLVFSVKDTQNRPIAIVTREGREGIEEKYLTHATFREIIAYLAMQLSQLRHRLSCLDARRKELQKRYENVHKVRESLCGRLKIFFEEAFDFCWSKRSKKYRVACGLGCVGCVVCCGVGVPAVGGCILGKLLPMFSGLTPLQKGLCLLFGGSSAAAISAGGYVLYEREMLVEMYENKISCLEWWLVERLLEKPEQDIIEELIEEGEGELACAWMTGDIYQPDDAGMVDKIIDEFVKKMN